jgi:hypothetical protein
MILFAQRVNGITESPGTKIGSMAGINRYAMVYMGIFAHLANVTCD